MPRKPRTDAERALHRVHIAISDLHEAAEFIEAALVVEAGGVADLTKDVLHKALMCAAVVYYARPFGPNEHRNPSKRSVEAADSTVDLGPLSRWIEDPLRRQLHRQIILQRNKIVAHAEGRFFEVKMFRTAALQAIPPGSALDYVIRVRRIYPRFNLAAMLQNTVDLRRAYSWISHAIAPQVRRGKRLRRLRS